MTVNVYVVTYNNRENINLNLKRFSETTEDVDEDFVYTIINNHTIFQLDYAQNIHDGIELRCFDNSLRPDHSCGHLARDYNMGLIDGFQDLNNPACDQVILLHDDSIWMDGWYQALSLIHREYDFYAGDWGDGLTSYLPSAVKRIGLWDERFCNIGYHEADYFLRAAIYNRHQSSINDKGAGRVLNPTKDIFYHNKENENKKVSHDASAKFHDLTHALFQEKWGCSPVNWDLYNLPSGPRIKSWPFYPYFEKDCRAP